MSTQQLFTNARIFDGTSWRPEPHLLLSDGRVAAFLHDVESIDSERIDLEGQILTPGFVDLQVNGGGEAFFSIDQTMAALQEIARVHRESGTTALLATQVTAPWSNILRAIELVRDAMQVPELGIVGLHLEGPFLNPEKRGAHLPQYLLEPEDALLDELIEKGAAVIKLLTIAPELFSDAQIERLMAAGIRLSAGHSMATAAAAQRAFGLGVDKVTHLFNAMSPWESRAPGLVGACLGAPEVWAGIIADGIHLDYLSLELSDRLKPERLFLVSDAYLVRTKRRDIYYDDRHIIFTGDRFLTPSNQLAGAAITQSDGLYNCIHHANISPDRALQMVTSRPAEYLGLSPEYGRMVPGHPTHLVILDQDFRFVRTLS